MKLEIQFYRIIFIAIAVFEMAWGFYMDSFSMYRIDPNDGLLSRSVLSIFSVLCFWSSYYDWGKNKLNYILIFFSYAITIQQLYYSYLNSDSYKVLFASFPPILLAIIVMPSVKHLVVLTLLTNIFGVFIQQDNFYFSFNLFTYTINFFIFKYFFIKYSDKLISVKKKDEQLLKYESLKGFIKGLSHEINNRNTKIDLSLDLIKEKALKDKSIVKAINILRDDNDKFNNLMDRLNSIIGKDKPQMIEEIDKKELKNIYRELIKDMKDKIIVNYPDCVEGLYFDKKEFKNMVRIFIDNARESFFKDDNYIEINHVIKRDNLYITISDNGNPISEEIKEKMFDVFLSDKDIIHHNGLGLNIAQRIIYDNKGEIFFSEENEWKDFKIKIPLRK